MKQSILHKKAWLPLILGVTFFFGALYLRAEGASQPPAHMNFSVLDDSNPVTEFEVLPEQYKGALGTAWKEITIDSYLAMKWVAPFTNDCFSISPSKLSKKAPYKSYLVSPALKLAEIGGKKLSLMLSSGSSLGESPLRILIINKEGGTIRTLLTEKPKSTGNKDFQPVEVLIPSDLQGIGFIAFVAEGDITNSFRQFKIQNPKLATASTEVSITSNPQSLSFDVIAAGEVGPTKSVNVFISNFVGVPLVTLTGPYSEDYRIIDKNALTQTGGTLKVIYEPKSGGENKNAAIKITAGPKSYEIPITGRATGAAPKIKVYSQPENLKFTATEIGKTSSDQYVTITIERAVEKPEIVLKGRDIQDFVIKGVENITAKGGNLAVAFSPKQKGERMATIQIDAQGTIYNIPLTGNGEAGVSPEPEPSDNRPEPKEDKELLADQFFYDFNEDDTPSTWKYEGNVKKLNRGYNNSTGFAVTIDATQSNVGGAIYQEIDLKSFNFKASEGDMLEGMIHYRVQEPFHEEGAVRLACEFLDANGRKVISQEDGFIHHNRYFEYRKAWDEVMFRTIIPKNATKFRFRIETHAGTWVDLDDFSLLRLTKMRAAEEFVSVIPHAFNMVGELRKPMKEKVLVQSMRLQGERSAVWESPDGAGPMTLNPSTLPEGNKIQDVEFTITGEKKGSYEKGASGTRPYVVQFQGEMQRATFSVNAFIIDPNNPPKVELNAETQIRKMACLVGETDMQELRFDVTGVIRSVDLKVIQGDKKAFTTNTNQFYYSKSQDDVLNKSVKITFRPLEAIDYQATLTVQTVGMQTKTFVIQGTGKTMAGGWIEEFTADKPKDPRFTTDVWNDYHLFDRGYWYLEGRLESKGNVKLKGQGIIESDEWFYNGIENITITPAASASQCDLYYSVDGGGHWTRVEKAPINGRYTVDTHRPTRFRFVNKTASEVTINKIALIAHKEEDRTKFEGIADAMLRNVDQKPLTLLSQDFNRTRHTRGMAIEGWQNIIVSADRPFFGWDQKDKTTGKVEENCAQISFLNSINKEDVRPQEAWLISPAISYSQAKTGYLTFRLRYELPTEDGKEKFGVYVISQMKDGSVRLNFLDITKLLLTDNIDTDTWYDYYVDLSKLNFEVDETIHIAFTMYSPKGGKYTSLTFMVDDVTFGRSDLTKVKTDKEQLTFNFQPQIKCPAQTINVSVDNPYYPIAVTLVPNRLNEKFLLRERSLPENGGTVSVEFLSKEQKNHAAALLLQVRGGISAMVRLMAQYGNSIQTPDALRTTRVYPTVATDKIQIEGTYDRYYIFSANGALVQEGAESRTINVADLSAGVYFVRLSSLDGGSTTHRFVKE